jgi:hypothetical protein
MGHPNRNIPPGVWPMQFKMQLVVCAEDSREEQVYEVMALDKPCQRLEHLGLTLAEAKALLKTRQ